MDENFKNLELYLDYCIINITLKHSFELKFKDSIVWFDKGTILFNRPIPDNPIEVLPLWKNTYISSFEDFINNQSIPHSLKHWKMIKND